MKRVQHLVLPVCMCVCVVITLSRLGIKGLAATPAGDRQLPSGLSQVYQVMRLRTDGVHCRESVGTGPVVLKGARITPNQEHPYGPNVKIANHTAYGPGLSLATTGTGASFTIRLADENGSKPEGDWNVDKHRFIYVWIANADQIFTAGVENNGDGTLTATYESCFPGDYHVFVEDVDLRASDENGKGRPIKGSPFPLTIIGEATLDVEGLSVCGAGGEDVASTYWRTGSWISSNIASTKHGVLRDGWVFQPRSCVLETFSYEDLIILAALEEPTWLLAVGNSILRGVYLTLVDLVLVQGQKDELGTSVIEKCWGFADMRIGNLRLTYQDLRLYAVTSVENATVCNDEKLESGSTAAYITSARLFFQETVFQEGQPWPDVIWAPSNMVDMDEAPNVQINVIMDALPAGWKGTLVMLDHLYGFGYGWNTANPTLQTMAGVNPVNEHSVPTVDHGIARMERYRRQYNQTIFMSVFPMYQAKIFENEESRVGKQCYGCSIHFHYTSQASSPEALDGAKMVHSSITEMLANIIISKAVGTKAAVYEKVASTPDIEARLPEVKRVFQICADCPATLLPYHVKPVPTPTCETVSSLPGNATVGKAWDDALCPDWCLMMDPVGEKATMSGPVSVRVCSAALPAEP